MLPSVPTSVKMGYLNFCSVLIPESNIAMRLDLYVITQGRQCSICRGLQGINPGTPQAVTRHTQRHTP